MQPPLHGRRPRGSPEGPEEQPEPHRCFTPQLFEAHHRPDRPALQVSEARPGRRMLLQADPARNARSCISEEAVEPHSAEDVQGLPEVAGAQGSGERDTSQRA